MSEQVGNEKKPGQKVKYPSLVPSPSRGCPASAIAPVCQRDQICPVARVGKPTYSPFFKRPIRVQDCAIAVAIT